MKKIFVAVLLLLSFYSVKSQNNYRPTLKEVVEKFDNTYSFSITNGLLNLSKNPNGWSTYEMKYIGTSWKKTNEQLFWSTALQKYLPLNYKAKKNKKKQPLRDIVLSDVYNYERNYYHGYKGAAKDVITELGNKKNLSDTLLDGLARAYSRYARSFVENMTGYTTSSTFSDTGFITENLADSFVKYVDKGIETFGLLHKQNPEYQTIVGSIYQKYCNEYMYAYLVLCEWGYEDKAKKYLKPNLYEESFLSLTKNYLSTIEDNSIFLTNGDNDTYPLLYLQIQQGFKNSVHIINLSLLGKPRYLQLLQKGYGGKPPLKLSISQKAYNSFATSYMLTDDNDKNQKISSINELITFLNSKNYNDKNDIPIRISLENKNISNAINKAACISANLVGPEVETPNQIELKLKSVIYRSELAVLDILHTNNWQNNIYIANSYERIEFGEYLRNVGLMYILFPIKKPMTAKYSYVVDNRRLYDNITNKFHVNTSDKNKNGSEYVVTGYNLRRAYYDYLQSYNGNEKTSIATKGLNILPNSFLKYDFSIATLAFVLMDEQPKKAEEVLITVVHNLLDEFHNEKPLRQLSYSKKDALRVLKSKLEIISQQTKSYDFSNLEATLAEANADLESVNNE
ncbi:MAG: hypothetical protein ACN6I4_00460 [bacterium]